MATTRKAALQAALAELDSIQAPVPTPTPVPEPSPEPTDRDLLKSSLQTLQEVVGTFAPLVKAGGDYDSGTGNAAEDRDDHGEDEDFDEEDEGDGERPEEPGYGDMNMGRNYADVTDLLTDMAAADQAQLDSHRSMHAKMARLEKAVMTLAAERGPAQELAVKTANAIVGLSKAMHGLLERLDAVQAPALTSLGKSAPTLALLRNDGPTPRPGTRPTVRGGRRMVADTELRKAAPADGGFLAGVRDSASEMRLLAKALGKNIIDEDEVQAWQNHGRFSNDDATNTRLIEAIQEIA